ncbi:MAG TPA: hypothetical protein VLH09_09500, partial [Bryobacteraceae bacterium]|nr:hypothetical protein [Bryobacteraceae bacterium]
KRELSGGELILNLRAEAPPDLLHEAVEDAVAASGVRARVLRSEHFRPARPIPTHRIEAV